MLTVETYNENADHGKVVLVKANDNVRSYIILLGVVVIIVIEHLIWFAELNLWFAIFIRFVYAACIGALLIKSWFNDENTLIASGRGLYFSLSPKQRWRKNQYLLVPWESIDRCQYVREFNMKVKTKILRRHVDNYQFDNIKLVDLELTHAGIDCDSFFEKNVIINTSKLRIRKWKRLMRQFPVSVVELP